jgi:hypothetical protein
VRVSVRDGELAVRWSYSESRHDRRTVVGLAERLLEELRLQAELNIHAEGLVHTPSDFPLARVDQGQLDQLLGRL